MNARRSPSTILTERDIESVVLAIRAVDHESAWERVLEIGRLVFEEIIGGSEEEWRSRRSRKSVSLRKLVQHARCPYRKSTLCSAVNVHLLVKAQPSVRSLQGITPTHVTQTLTLSQLQALRLLIMASEAGWSARELGHTVRSLRREAGERRGRPASPIDRRADLVGRRAAASLRDMHNYLAACKSICDESLRAVQVTLEEVSELVARIHDLPVFARRSALMLVTNVAQPAGETGAATG
jgi:hypothetical protein